MLQLIGPWVPTFKASIESEAAEFITFSFATTGLHGRPKVRTCVFRGFLFNNSKTNVLTFTTDKRMLKYKELQKSCHFEACFYFHKSKKQFRFSGLAKIIDNEIYPSIKLPQIPTQAGSIENEAMMSNDDNDINEDNNEIKQNDDDELENELIMDEYDEAGGEDDEKLEDSLEYPLYSPKVVEEYKILEQDPDHHHHHPHHLHGQDHGLPELIPPTKEEWDNELNRQWEKLSRSMKSSFRKPTPGSKIDQEKRTILDAISRRVDGNKDEVGLDQFAVVCMFVNVVDFVDLDNLNNRRWIMNRVKGDQWKEREVCP